jgi:RNA polymerase sigma-70 factor (ECF subfamily)
VSEGAAALWLAAREAWPGLEVTADDFARYLASHAAAGDPPPDRAADLYLACACAARAPGALEVFERLLASAVARATARIDASRSFTDLVAQDLRTRLLVGDPPKIAEYEGRAPLGSWLKTAAVRSALSHRCAQKNQPHDELPSGPLDPAAQDLELVRARFVTDFEDALRSALATLPEGDRALLRASVRDRIPIEKLAVTHGVGRSTIARWLAAARERINVDTRRTLQVRLGLTASELDSFMIQVRGDIDVSVVRLLQQPDAG